MDASQWGPAGWTFLHAISFAQAPYPSSDQQRILKQFFESIGHVLPCVKCCKHYQEFVAQHPPPVHDRELLCRWLVDAHNNANEENRAKMPVKMPLFTYEEAVKRYAYDTDILLDTAHSEKLAIKKYAYIAGAATIGVIILLCVGILIYSCTGGRVCPAHRYF